MSTQISKDCLSAPSTKKSWVWKYFGVKNGDKDETHAYCLICLEKGNEVRKACKANTSKLIDHLQSYHSISKPIDEPDQPTIKQTYERKERKDVLSGEECEKLHDLVIYIITKDLKPIRNVS